MKPDCIHCRERFSEYLDGLLPAPERAEVDAHLAACAECSRELARWRATLQAAGALRRQAAPEGFRARVMARLDQETGPAPAPPARPWLLSLWVRALPVAAMLLLVFGVVAIVQRNGALTARQRPVALARRPEPAMGIAAAPARPVTVTTSTGAQAGGAPASYDRAAGFAYQPSEDEERAGRRMAARPQAEQRAPRTDLAGAKGAVVADALKDGTGAREQMMALMTTARPGGGELFFQQMQAVPRAVERPEQVLTLYSADPADLIRRAIETANRQGLEVTLVFKPGGRADISVQVPAAGYEPLVTALSNLTAPESQTMSNSALAQGEFFRKALDNYNVSNRLRQKEQASEQMRVAARPVEAGIRLNAPEARPRSEEAVRGSANAVAGPPPAPPAVGAQLHAMSQTEAAPAAAAAPEKPSAGRGGGGAPPRVVNLQITIERLPAPQPPAR